MKARTTARLTLVTILLIGLVPLQAKDFKGAEIYSRTQVRYGKWEIRMRMARASGVLSTFFTYKNNSAGSGAWREIDIEVLGKDTNNIQTNIMTGNMGGIMTVEHYYPRHNLTTEYHTYAMQWTPDSVTWFFNGNIIRSTRNQQVVDLRDSDQSYRMNIWSSFNTGWVGQIDVNALPAHQFVNWIRYSSYTPGQGDEGTDFTFQWQDDFNTFDANRWNRATHTWDDNRTDFVQSNVVVQEGYLILCLTTPAATGFRGTIPPDEAASPAIPRSASAAPVHQSLRIVSRGEVLTIGGLDNHWSSAADLRYAIHTVNGTVVREGALTASSQQASISLPRHNLPCGIYCLKLTDGSTRLARRFQIMR